MVSNGTLERTKHVQCTYKIPFDYVQCVSISIRANFHYMHAYINEFACASNSRHCTNTWMQTCNIHTNAQHTHTHTRKEIIPNDVIPLSLSLLTLSTFRTRACLLCCCPCLPDVNSRRRATHATTMATPTNTYDSTFKWVVHANGPSLFFPNARVRFRNGRREINPVEYVEIRIRDVWRSTRANPRNQIRQPAREDWRVSRCRPYSFWVAGGLAPCWRADSCASWVVVMFVCVCVSGENSTDWRADDVRWKVPLECSVVVRAIQADCRGERLSHGLTCVPNPRRAVHSDVWIVADNIYVPCTYKVYVIVCLLCKRSLYM